MKYLQNTCTCKLMKKASQRIGLRWQMVVKYTCSRNNQAALTRRRKQRKGIVSSVATTVEEFLMSNSTPRPDERSVSKKTNLRRRDLDKTGRNLYRSFGQKHKHTKLSFSAFSNLKQDYITPVTKKPHISCLCEYCANINLKIDTFNELFSRKSHDNKIKNRYEPKELMLCPDPTRKCIKVRAPSVDWPGFRFCLI